MRNIEYVGKSCQHSGTILDYDKSRISSLALNDSAMPTVKNEMTTLSMVIEKLRLKRQDNEFRMTEKGFGTDCGKIYTPEELSIIRTYRFEGNSDPSDSSILYLIEANDGRIGYSVDAYGAYSNHDDAAYDDFIRKIPVREREEQTILG
jgi:hypothetical protein